MTSLLRKKHLTTPLNTHLEIRSEEQGARSEEQWFASSNPRSAIGNPQFSTRRSQLRANLTELAVLLAALLTAYCLLANTAQAELQWQRGRTPSASKSGHQKAAPKFSRVQPQSHKVDSAIQQVAYEEEEVSGPQLTGVVGQARLRSVVVNREEEAADDGSIRSAQLPFGDSTPGTSSTEPPAPADTKPGTVRDADPNTQFEEELRSPFGEMPENQDLRTPNNNNQRQPRAGSPQDPPDTQLIDNPKERIPRNVPTTGDRMLDPGEPVPGEPDTGAERKKAQEFCSDEFAKLKASTLLDVSLSISVSGTEGEDFPFECSIDDGNMAPNRCWCQTTYLWKASALCHKPLYFEEEQLERYGHSCRPCFQPFVSGAHFFCTLPVLPYCMGVEPPMECVYALGHYRPGSCAPYMINPVPLSCRGALFQAGAVTGAAAAIP